MKIVGIVVGVLLALFLISGCNSYNKMVTMDEAVTAQWKQVEVAYQARLDKTKNLFEIVQSSADFERGTLKDVMEARAKATSVHIDAKDATPKKLLSSKKLRTLSELHLEDYLLLQRTILTLKQQMLSVISRHSTKEWKTESQLKEEGSMKWHRSLIPISGRFQRTSGLISSELKNAVISSLHQELKQHRISDQCATKINNGISKRFFY